MPWSCTVTTALLAVFYPLHRRNLVNHLLRGPRPQLLSQSDAQDDPALHGVTQH